ncbi:MAG: hypothetical protein ABI036_00830, partial [Fibrobacteria bacterium]
KAKSGIYATLGSTANPKDHDPAVAIALGFAGLKMEASVLFWDGFISKKGEISLIDKKETKPFDLALSEYLESLAKSGSNGMGM